MVEAALPVSERRLARIASTGLSIDRFELLLIQHLRQDTAKFVRLLRQFGFSVGRVIAIEYSTEEQAARELQAAGVVVEEPAISEIPALAARVVLSRGRPVVVCEVGGHCAAELQRCAGNLRGVIEETRSGLFRYEQLTDVHVPIIQLAVSRLKAIEATYVGDAVARGIGNSLLELGISLRGLRTLVLGVGMIGTAAAQSLRRNGADVTCYDIDPVQLLRAATYGFDVGPRTTALARAQLIVGASGRTSLGAEDYEVLSDGVLLGSASSRQTEFNVAALRTRSRRSHHVASTVEEFEMPWGRRLLLMNQGFPVNFPAGSLPFPIADLLFAQVASALALLFGTGELRGGIQALPQAQESEIALEWLNEYHESFRNAAK